MQNNQINGNQELIAFLTQKFESIDRKFEGFDEQLAVFKKQYVDDYKDLVELFSGQFEKFNEKLDRKPDKMEVETMIKTEIDRVMNRIVRQSDKIDDNRAEQIEMQRQVDKHEKWHFQTATKIGLKLQPE